MFVGAYEGQDIAVVMQERRYGLIPFGFYPSRTVNGQRWGSCSTPPVKGRSLQLAQMRGLSRLQAVFARPPYSASPTTDA